MIGGFVRSVGMLGLICFSIDSPAAAPEPLLPLTSIPTDIKSQPLADALTAWAELTGYQIVVPQSDAAERVVQRIEGNMTAQESLDRLLAGTGLMFERINDRTIVIKDNHFAPPPVEPQIKQKRLLASLERIEVTGSRLLGDIRADGSVDTPAPVVIFERQTLDEAGISSVSELMRFIPQQPYGPRAESTTGTQHAEMRGLGRDTTLILFDGRRIIPSAYSVVWNAFDLNTLPLAAIESVEVLSDSASAVYGGDAIGGVINFILRKDIPRPILDVHYGSAAGGAEERRVSLGAGYSTDRLRTSVVLDYFDRGTLLGEERDRWNNQDFRRFGGEDLRSTQSNPGNVSSTTSANLPGLPSRFAAIPAQSTGIGLTTDDFLATAEQRNLDSLNQSQSIVPAALRRSVTAFADFDLTSSINLFAELMYFDNRTTQYSPLTATLTVPATNPFNPFGVPVSVDYLFAGLTSDFHITSKRYRAVTGLQGTSGDWDWELSTFRIGDKAASWREHALDPAKVNAALAETDPTKALNVFSDGAGSETLMASLTAQTTDLRPYLSDGTQASAVLRGRLITLPAGDVAVVLGSEWLESEILFDRTIRVARGRTAAAGFTELRLPLVSSQMQIPAIEKLSLTIAARYDRYSDFGDSFNLQYGLVCSPITDLILRASFGTAFRAPSLFELYASQTTAADIPTPDPLRDNEVSPVTFLGGGNPDLESTDADSLTVGFDWAPSALRGLQLSASYWRIQMDKQVDVLPYNLLAAHWEQFPDRVVRAEPTAEDIAAGRPGRLIFIDLTRMNVGSTETSGVDLSATYSIETPFGRFSPRLSATWIDQYETANVPGLPPTDRLGIATIDGTIAKWKAVATLGWDHRGVSLLATARYTAAYADADFNGFVTGRIIPSQTLIDLQGSVDLDDLLAWPGTSFTHLKLTAGVSNLFDKEPHFAEVGYTNGYDTTQGDLRQRFGYLRLSAQF